MILCAVVKFLLIIYAILWATLELDTPVVYAAKWGVLFFALMLDSFCRIFLFNVKQVIATSSGSKKGTTRPRTNTDAISISPSQLDVEN